MGRRGPAAGRRQAVRQGGNAKRVQGVRAVANHCLSWGSPPARLPRPTSPREHGDDELDALWPRAAAAGVSRWQWPVHGARRSLMRVGTGVGQVVGAGGGEEAASRGSRVRVVGAGGRAAAEGPDAAPGRRWRARRPHVQGSQGGHGRRVVVERRAWRRRGRVAKVHRAGPGGRCARHDVSGLGLVGGKVSVAVVRGTVVAVDGGGLRRGILVDAAASIEIVSNLK